MRGLVGQGAGDAAANRRICPCGFWTASKCLALCGGCGGAAPSVVVAMSSFGSLLVLVLLPDDDCRLARQVTKGEKAAAAGHPASRARRGGGRANGEC